MLKVNFYKNKRQGDKNYGKVYGRAENAAPIGLEQLAEHMAQHNTPFSAGTIKGILTDMVGCIKELLLEGKNVKIADLAIFSLGIKNNGGADKAEDFNVVKHLKGVKLRARATGELVAKNLNASLKKAGAISTTSPQTTSPQPSPNGEGASQTGGENGNQGGSENQNQGGNQGGTTNPPSGGGNEND